MFIFSKISLTILFIITTVIFAESFGIIDKEYGNYIIYIGLAIQFVMLIILVIVFILRYKTLNLLKSGVKIVRHKFEDQYIKGDTEILPKYITTTNPRKSSIFKIYVEVKDFKEPPDFGICKKGGPTQSDITKHLLGVDASIIGDLFVFQADIIVRPNEKINFKFAKDENVKSFFVGELYIP